MKYDILNASPFNFSGGLSIGYINRESSLPLGFTYSVYFMDRAGGPNNFYTWWIHIGMFNNQAANSGHHPLTGSGIDDKNRVSMSKCVHLCQLIYWRCYLTLPAPAIKAQHFRSTLMPLMLFNHSTIHHSMS